MSSLLHSRSLSPLRSVLLAPARYQMAQSFEAWYNALPRVTRLILVATVVITAVSTFGLISPYWLVLTRSFLIDLQWWRPLTATLFLGNFSFPWLMSVGMLLTYLKYNEENDFKGKTADFVWMLLVLMIGLTVLGVLFQLPIVSFAFMMALCWVFCKRNPALRLSLLGFEFNANVFPWVLMGFHVILGQGILEDVCGIVVGHLFVFLRDVLPATHGHRLLETPLWLKRRIPELGNPGFQTLHPEVHPQDARFGQRNAPQQDPGRHNWGRGRPLGAN